MPRCCFQIKKDRLTVFGPRRGRCCRFGDDPTVKRDQPDHQRADLRVGFDSNGKTGSANVGQPKLGTIEHIGRREPRPFRKAGVRFDPKIAHRRRTRPVHHSPAPRKRRADHSAGGRYRPDRSRGAKREPGRSHRIDCGVTYRSWNAAPFVFLGRRIGVGVDSAVPSVAEFDPARLAFGAVVGPV